MAKRLKGWKGRISPARLVVLVLALALVAVLGYRQLLRSTGSRVAVFRAATHLAAGDVVSAEAITPVREREDGLPEGVLRERDKIEGRTLTRPKTVGTLFKQQDFYSAPQPPPGLAEILPEGRVMVTVTPSNFRPLDEMAALFRLGDRFDILALDRSGTTVVARDVYFAAWMRPRPPAAEPDTDDDDDGGSSLFGDSLRNLTPAAPAAAVQTDPTPLLVGLHPQDVAPLSLARTRGAYLFFVLHGRKEVNAGKLLRIDVLRDKQIELIVGGRRQTLRVQ